MDKIYRIFQFLGSLRMAVIVILSIAILSAIGTFLESRYNTEFAQVLIYKSWWMYGVMSLFCMSLIFSAVERLPWKKRHIPFLVAHIGLLILVLGQYMTGSMGLDGTLSIPISQQSGMVSITPKDLTLYASYDGDNYKSIYQREVSFIGKPPEKHDYSMKIDQETIKIKGFYPFAVSSQNVVKTDKDYDKPAIRFLLKNDNVSFSDWLVLSREEVVRDLGPAQVIFKETFDPKFFPKNNTVYFHLMEGKPAYKVFKKLNDRPAMSGKLSLGKPVTLPWMGMQLSLLSHFERAREVVEYEAKEYPSGITTAAILVNYKGEDHWLGVNSIIKFFTDSAAYVLSWGNRQVDLGFQIKLIEFRMDKYMGTNRAASYASLVDVPDVGEVLISMNEPLKYKGYTFYQASFQQDENGEPTATVLSVNYDPGRFWKYLGSALVVLGAILLFYFRKLMARKAAANS